MFNKLYSNRHENPSVKFCWISLTEFAICSRKIGNSNNTHSTRSLINNNLDLHHNILNKYKETEFYKSDRCNPCSGMYDLLLWHQKVYNKN